MSMLAERKVKQRWSLNPRGKNWSEDSNKFGQKLLEKMGWSRGKGLGAREDGIVDHLKVSYKNDSRGMGYKDSNDQWTEHDSNFNALLQSLSGETKVETDVKISASLEKKSQSSKVRVHYKKFTRGKDLSRCSEKDLANIFGKKSLTEIAKPEDGASSAKNIKCEPEEEKKESDFVINAGSMVDYFKKKNFNLKTFGKINGYTVGNNGVLKKEEESEEETFRGFGFNSDNDKKRKYLAENWNGTPKKSKREDDSINGFSNPAFDPLFNNVSVQKHKLNTIEEESEQKTNIDEKSEDIESQVDVNKKKAKKKNKLQMDNPNFDDSSFVENENSCINDTFEVKRKSKKTKEINKMEIEKPKKKAKKDISVAVDNPSFDANSLLDNDNSCTNDNFEVKRKKKKRKMDESTGIENPCCDDTSFVEQISLEAKRKKKRKSDVDMAVDNPNFDPNSADETQNSYVDQNFEVKRKKKKGKANQELAIDNPNFNDSSVVEEATPKSNFETRIKKRKKDKMELEIGLDNPNFSVFQNGDSENSFVDKRFEVERSNKKSKNKQNTDVEAENVSMKAPDESVQSLDEPVFDLMLNVTSTPSRPKINSKNDSRKPERVFPKRRKSVRFSDVTEERVIPSNEDVENRNELFDINSRVIANGLKKDSNPNSSSEDLEEISRKIDGFQAEIENDMNEAKVARLIGEVGNPEGENEKLPDGTKLKFKYAQFGRSPSWANRNHSSSSKSSYKHLIKGDIVVGFNNTNLHEVQGYGVKTYQHKV